MLLPSIVLGACCVCDGDSGVGLLCVRVCSQSVGSRLVTVMALFKFVVIFRAPVIFLQLMYGNQYQ